MRRAAGLVPAGPPHTHCSGSGRIRGVCAHSTVTIITVALGAGCEAGTAVLTHNWRPWEEAAVLQSDLCDRQQNALWPKRWGLLMELRNSTKTLG